MLALTDSALAPLYHLRHGPRPDRRRALALLANCGGRNAASRLLASPLGTCMALGRQWAMFE